MLNNQKLILRTIALFLLAFVFKINFSFANILNSWKDPKAYKPNPVLFLHGFAKGSAGDWNNIITTLSDYFSKYESIGFYLDAIDFQDPNGSVDRYPAGKFNPQGNSAGWADKVKNKVDDLLSNDNYGFYTNKINLVCHSMGGLAARYYLTNYSDDFVDKLILIGVPNLGSNLANLANAVAGTPKVGWLQILAVNNFVSNSRNALDLVLRGIGSIDMAGEAVDDMDPTATGSGFLNNLNSQPQPQKVNYFGVVGIVGSFLNRYISGDYYGGDGVVSRISQLGTGSVLYKDSFYVYASHWDEIRALSDGTNTSILYFLDSTKPEFEITSPDTNSATEITQPTIHIKGNVYKEYFPADSKLIINARNVDNGSVIPAQTSLLKASDLWIPKNIDSPVAEFDEIVNFPLNGTFEISCQIKNPSGRNSEVKKFTIRVNVLNASIVVHCHNPEGIEINSIQSVGNAVSIYDGATFIGYGANNSSNHNSRFNLKEANHAIKAVFNGITLSQDIALLEDETKIITFTFPRTDFDIYSHMVPQTVNASLVDTYSFKSGMSGCYGVKFSTLDTTSWRAYWFHDLTNLKNITYSCDNGNIPFSSEFSFSSYYGLTKHVEINFNCSMNSRLFQYTLSSMMTGEGAEIPGLRYGSYIDHCDFPFTYNFLTVPFNKWFSQYIIPPNCSDLLNIYITQPGHGRLFDLVDAVYPGYHFYSYSLDFMAYWAGPGPYVIYVPLRISIPATNSAGARSILQGVKLSSVPYDLLDTGV